MLTEPIILVVDDSEVNLNILNLMLSKEGYEIVLADSSEKALKIMEEKLPDLILLDIMMSGISGIELCKMLKEDKETQDIPVIFISVLEDVEDKVAAFQAGGVDYITKPFNKLEVKARIKNHLELKTAREEIQDLYNQLSYNLEKARKIHERFLPDSLPDIKDMSLSVYYHPAVKLGGDFYYFFQYKNKYIFYLSDVAGHGLDGALVNIFIREMIKNYLELVNEGERELSGDCILKYLSQKYVEEGFPEDIFICVMIGILDIQEEVIEFVNAGFQFPPFIVDAEGDVEVLNIAGPPISILTKNYEYEKILLDNKNINGFFITTDGLLEETNDDNIMFGDENIKKILVNNSDLPADFIIKIILEEFWYYIGDKRTARDDLTFLYLQKDVDILDKYRFKCYERSAEINSVLDRIDNIMKENSLDNNLLMIGINEAVSNAFKHLDKKYDNPYIIIEITVLKNYFIISIKDLGCGFDWLKYNKKGSCLDIEEVYESGTGSGMGLDIINKIFDYFFFNEKGNCIYMIKKK